MLSNLAKGTIASKSKLRLDPKPVPYLTNSHLQHREGGGGGPDEWVLIPDAPLQLGALEGW